MQEKEFDIAMETAKKIVHLLANNFMRSENMLSIGQMIIIYSSHKNVIVTIWCNSLGEVRIATSGLDSIVKHFLFDVEQQFVKRE